MEKKNLLPQTDVKMTINDEQLPQQMEQLTISSSMNRTNTNNNSMFVKLIEDNSAIAAKHPSNISDISNMSNMSNISEMPNVSGNGISNLGQYTYRRRSDTALYQAKWPKMNAAKRFYQGRRTINGPIKSPTKYGQNIMGNRQILREPILQSHFNRHNYHKHIAAPYPILNLAPVDTSNSTANNTDNIFGYRHEQLMEHVDIAEHFKHLQLNNTNNIGIDKNRNECNVSGDGTKQRKAKPNKSSSYRCSLSTIEEDVALENMGTNDDDNQVMDENGQLPCTNLNDTAAHSPD